MVVDWSQCPVLESVPGKLSGAWVFRGTRVPVSLFLSNLKCIDLDEMTQDYPSVSRAQMEAVLNFLATSAELVFPGEPIPELIIHAHPSR